MMRHFARLFEHMAWADGRVLATLAESGDERALRLFAHVLAAERVWLLRLRGEDSSAEPIWPERAREELAPIARENARAYAEFVAALSDEGVDDVVEYRNSAGTAFRTPVVDILSQVALHGSYHRGQIAASLRASGEEPASTDFIVFARL